MTRIVALVRKVGAGLYSVAGHVIGRWEWHRPVWVHRTGQQGAKAWKYLTEDRRRLLLLMLLVVSAIAGVAWYKARPMPHYVQYRVTSPALTEYDENGIASIKPLRIQFSESAVLLRNIEKRVTTGIDLSPAIAGTWFWVNDKQLSFYPKERLAGGRRFQRSFRAEGRLCRTSGAGRLQARFPKSGVHGKDLRQPILPGPA
ncbi:MAG: alpha-2-macroglobulin [Bryobacterales bacterium]|jgi:hypothetical protein|nr:alpha-2-macroglobulin [Bryobacterales bacterium]